VSLPPWYEAPISKRHDRESFDCGDSALNVFLRQHARKSHDVGGAKTFLAIDAKDGKTVLGYYSLSPASVEYARTPDIVKRGLGRYDVPGFRLVRLAIARPFQGHGLGTQLLLAAGRRCLKAAAEVGGVVLVIDAKNESVAEWYAARGAMALQDTPLVLVLPLATIRQALKIAGQDV
jgi:GNAT superfamily N-acetyltransferase